MKQRAPNIFQGFPCAKPGFLGQVLKNFSPQTIIGHPTFYNQDNIGNQLRRGILGAVENFAGQKTAFIVSDGTCTQKDPNTATIDAALRAAQETLQSLPQESQNDIFVFAGSYDGYGNDFTPGKGSALKLIFDEMGYTAAKTLILLDGDLRNDMAAWQRVFKETIALHERHAPDQDYFITSRYARHFVDASLTRMVVGPLTTLMGTYVPGGISGDVVLSAGAVALERASEWTSARRRYGTDIATTLDNIAAGTAIYEVYLGAKLHDITDDAKLNVMPAEVIGAALERLLYYESLDKRISRLLAANIPLRQVVARGPRETGIGFIDPGETNVFHLSTKRQAMAEKFPLFEASMRAALRPATFAMVQERHARLCQALRVKSGEPLFLGIGATEWTGLLHETLGYALAVKDTTHACSALNYLYTAAFLEFCGQKFAELGCASAADIERVQEKLCAPKEGAQAFYAEKVDAVVQELAFGFFKNRKAILNRAQELAGN